VVTLLTKSLMCSLTRHRVGKYSYWFKNKRFTQISLSLHSKSSSCLLMSSPFSILQRGPSNQENKQTKNQNIGSIQLQVVTAKMSKLRLQVHPSNNSHHIAFTLQQCSTPTPVTSSGRTTTPMLSQLSETDPKARSALSHLCPDRF